MSALKGPVERLPGGGLTIPLMAEKARSVAMSWLHKGMVSYEEAQKGGTFPDTVFVLDQRGAVHYAVVAQHQRSEAVQEMLAQVKDAVGWVLLHDSKMQADLGFSDGTWTGKKMLGGIVTVTMGVTDFEPEITLTPYQVKPDGTAQVFITSVIGKDKRVQGEELILSKYEWAKEAFPVGTTH